MPRCKLYVFCSDCSASITSKMQFWVSGRVVCSACFSKTMPKEALCLTKFN